MVSETFRPVPGFVGYYEVSDRGTVRSVDRVVPTKNGTMRCKGRILSPAVHDGGHLFVSLYKDKKQHQASVHALVLLAFVGPYPDGMEIRHLDGVPSNNTLENLRYGTRSQNAQDSVAHGTHRNTAKTHCPAGHAYEGDNLYVCARGKRSCKKCWNPSNRVVG